MNKVAAFLIVLSAFLGGHLLADEERTVGCQAIMVLGGVALGAAVTAVAIYPAIGTSELLKFDGTPACLNKSNASQIQFEVERDSLEMAKNAYIVTASAWAASALLAVIAHFTDGDNHPKTLMALYAATALTFLTGFSSDLAGLIKAQRSYNLLKNNIEQDCSVRTTKGLENVVSKKFKAVLGFSYTGVILPVLFGVSAAANILHDYVASKCEMCMSRV